MRVIAYVLMKRVWRLPEGLRKIKWLRACTGYPYGRTWVSVLFGRFPRGGDWWDMSAGELEWRGQAGLRFWGEGGGAVCMYMHMEGSAGQPRM